MYGTLTFKEQVEGLEPQWRMRMTSHRRRKKIMREQSITKSQGNSSRMMAWLICQTLLRSQVRLKKKFKEDRFIGFYKKVVNFLARAVSLDWQV